MQSGAAFSIAGVIVAAAEDGQPIVKQEQDQSKKQRDSDGWPADPVNGVRFASGENVGDEGAAIRGEELDNEEDNGKEYETHGAQNLGNRLCYGLALVAEHERT